MSFWNTRRVFLAAGTVRIALRKTKESYSHLSPLTRFLGGSYIKRYSLSGKFGHEERFSLRNLKGNTLNQCYLFWARK